jgi:uncharacterized membrane protein
MMLGITVSYVLFRFILVSPFTANKKGFLVIKITWWILAFSQLFLVIIYPLFAVNSYYNNLKDYRGLDGLSWLWKTYPGDRAAIDFFRENLKEFDQPTILEAVGESYTDYARISANSGLPTVQGWPVHEWLWRGSYDEAGRRQTEVQQAYEAQDINLVKQFLKKFQVKYVIVGKLEKDKYTKLNEKNFFDLGKIVFQKGKTTIYQIDQSLL